jgi:hypothetical protein
MPVWSMKFLSNLKISSRIWLIGASCAALIAPVFGMALVQYNSEYEEPPINYTLSTPTDSIARLQQQIDKGQVKLAYNAQHGYLNSVLHALNIPVSSQMLVFSKTSFQRDLISPYMPRALYFNDNTYIGWVQGGRALEVSTVDPQLGAVFYILNQDKAEKPRFTRQTHECLQCHDSNMAGGVPGHIMRSVYTRADGQPELREGSYITTDQSPMKERWGGWYVTGTHGAQRHLGNIIFHGEDTGATLNLDKGANVTDLRALVDTSPYLSKHSDIVALMVIEHQTHLDNLITRANHQTRMALHYEQELNRELSRPQNYRSDSTISRIKSAGEPLVKAMLFLGEPPLTSPVAGTSGFTTQFAAKGPRDKQGRSLRELNLKTRLFKYPCSYLIYSDAFDGLPTLAKEYVYRRLWEILDGQDKSADFAHLSETDRKAILEILLDTKPDFAASKPH